MQRQINMEVTARAARGKNAARRLRATGSVPAVIYGLGREPQAVSVDARTMTNVLKEPAGHNRILNLTSDGSQEPAMAVDYQIDPVRNSLLHVDLLRVDLEKPVKVSVPIVSVGVAFGVKTEGGFEEMVNREVQIECLPLDIPEQIEVDISALHVGQAIRAKDIPASDRYVLADDDQKLLLHIMASRASAETVVAEEEITETESKEQNE